MPILDPAIAFPHIHIIFHSPHSPFFAELIDSLMRLDVFNNNPIANSAVASEFIVKQISENKQIIEIYSSIILTG
jgi:hypothetical protein